MMGPKMYGKEIHGRRGARRFLGLAVGAFFAIALTACAHTGVGMTQPGERQVKITSATEQQLPQGETSYRIGPADVLQVDVYPVKGISGQRKIEYSNEIHLEFYFDDGSYRISRGDELGIELAGESDKVYDVAVLPNGVINLPRIGRVVTAIGHTPSELAAKLDQEYAVLLRKPQVIVSVKKSGLDELQRLSGNYTVDPDGQIVIPLLGACKILGLNADEVAKSLAVRAKDYFQNRVDVVASIMPITSGPPDSRLAPDGEQYFHNAVKVGPDGSIFIPDAGVFQAGGKTLDELNREIQAALARVYQNEVQVRVAVQESPSQNVFIGGEVRSPGKYPHNDSLTLLQLISSAGWVTDNADLSQIVLLHLGADNRYVVYRTDLLEVVEGKARLRQDLRLSPRDIVVVPKSGVAKVDQWVDQYVRRVLPFGTSVNYTFTNQQGTVATQPLSSK